MMDDEKEWADFLKANSISEVKRPWKVKLSEYWKFFSAIAHVRWFIPYFVLATFPMSIVGVYLIILFDGREYEFSVLHAVLLFISVIIPIAMYANTLFKLVTAEL